MASKAFDKIDVFLSTAFVVFNLVSLEQANIDLFGTKLAESVYTVAGQSLSLAFIGSVAIFAFVYLTNNSPSDLRNYSDEYMYTVLGTIALIISIQFVPAVQDAATSSDLAALTVLGVEAMGYAAVSYLA